MNKKPKPLSGGFLFALNVKKIKFFAKNMLDKFYSLCYAKTA